MGSLNLIENLVRAFTGWWAVCNQNAYIKMNGNYLNTVSQINNGFDKGMNGLLYRFMGL